MESCKRDSVGYRSLMVILHHMDLNSDSRITVSESINFIDKYDSRQNKNSVAIQIKNGERELNGIMKDAPIFNQFNEIWIKWIESEGYL